MLFTPLLPPTFGLVAAAEWNWTKLRFYVLSLSSALLAATLVQNQGVSVTFAGLNRLFINLKRKIFHKFDNNSNCINVETSHWRDNWDPETGGHCLPPQARCFFLKHIVFGNLNFGKCIFVLNRECMPGMYSGAGTCLACHASCKTCDGSKVFFTHTELAHQLFIFLQHFSLLLHRRRETAPPATLSTAFTSLLASQPALGGPGLQHRSQLWS